MNPTPDLLALAHAAASKHALDFCFAANSQTYSAAALVCAIVEQESAWDACAIRYEPAFRTRYVAPLGLTPTEEVARSMSWGLMQVMGQVAREHGFAGTFLSALTDPASGLDIGCAVLASKIAAAKQSSEPSGQGITLDETTITRALQLWNGGANPDYATQVLARINRYC